MHSRSVLALACASLLASACAGTVAPRGTTVAATQSHRQVHGEEFHVVGTADGRGDGYDAAMLFDRGNAAVHAQHCDAALADYERLVREFPTSRLVPSAQYNRGVCLQSLGRNDDAVGAYRETAAHASNEELVHDAWFRIAAVGEAAQQPPLVLEAAATVLALPHLTVAERVEAYTRQAAALLAQGDRPGAVHAAEQAIALAPTPEAASALGNDSYIAQAHFLTGEATRLDAAQITVDVQSAQLEDAITRRVQLVTHAHTLFNASIRVGNPHWAAASGFSIGEMYRALYESIVHAPMPSDWDAHAVELYREHTGRRLRPLLQGALRAWEATLEMARRNGIADNDWVRRTDAQIDDLRNAILNGPSAPAHGAPPANPPPRANPPTPSSASAARVG